MVQSAWIIVFWTHSQYRVGINGESESYLPAEDNILRAEDY